ncbi:MAG TPA: DNA polymerase III subunit delta' [Bacteroidota bacterium]|nr:DNA polymerase III subunit delta' [Bacteroidota bacterium]
MSWNSIIGQERARAILRRSIDQKRIAHAYLLWGPRGVGKDALAIEFAKALLCERQQNEACDACPSCKKVHNLQHPNLRLVFALPAGKGDKSGSAESKFQPDLRDEIRSQLDQKARNPYFHFDIPKATQINIGSIREVKRESSMSAFEKGKKVFVISEAEMMNDTSANSLLKVLEEPLSDTIFLLTTSRKEQLLSTIVSRCQSIRCDLLIDTDIEQALVQRESVDPVQAQLVSRLAGGDYSYALELISGDVGAKREEAVDFLRATLGGQTVKVLEAIDERIGENDRGAVEQFLLLLLVWLRDALILKERGPAGIINQDQKEALSRFIVRFGNADLPATVAVVERALELLRGNVYLPLVLLSLSIRLKRLLLNER